MLSTVARVFKQETANEEGKRERERDREISNKRGRVRNHLYTQVPWSVRKKTKLAFHVRAALPQGSRKQIESFAWPRCTNAPLQGNSIHFNMFGHLSATRRVLLPVPFCVARETRRLESAGLLSLGASSTLSKPLSP